MRQPTVPLSPRLEGRGLRSSPIPHLRSPARAIHRVATHRACHRPEPLTVCSAHPSAARNHRRSTYSHSSLTYPRALPRQRAPGLSLSLNSEQVHGREGSKTSSRPGRVERCVVYDDKSAPTKLIRQIEQFRCEQRADRLPPNSSNERGSDGPRRPRSERRPHLHSEQFLEFADALVWDWIAIPVNLGLEFPLKTSSPINSLGPVSPSHIRTKYLVSTLSSLWASSTNVSAGSEDALCGGCLKTIQRTTTTTSNVSPTRSTTHDGSAATTSPTYGEPVAPTLRCHDSTSTWTSTRRYANKLAR